MQNFVQILAPAASARLKYTLDLVLVQLLGLRYELFSEKAVFESSPHPHKLVYTNENEQLFANIPALWASGWQLMGSSLIEPQIIDYELFVVDEPIILGFAHKHPNSLLGYDMLAWVFYLVSRYEEYLPFEADVHGRFSARRSVAWQKNFLDKPVINMLIRNFGKILEKIYPNLHTHSPAYTFLPTYDIDYMYAYKGKGFWRQMGAFGRSLLKAYFKQLKAQLATHLLGAPDPYDSWAYILHTHQHYAQPARFFFLIGDWGEYDKNLNHQHPLYAEWLGRVQKHFEIGLHPSYGAYLRPQQLATEKNRLETLAQAHVSSSRQHFLKLSLPHTYQQLASVGIEADYSMGYADALGFRASICTPFDWFDLSLNQATRLKIVPFALMDVTLKNYLQLSPEQAMAEIRSYKNIYRAQHGYFTPIWHNSSFSEEWKDWKKVYEVLFEY